MFLVNVAVTHPFTHDEIILRTKSHFKAVFRNILADLLGAWLASKTNLVREEWKGNTLNFSFSAVIFLLSGELVVEPSDIKIACWLPDFFAPMKIKTEQIIRKNVEAAFKFASPVVKP